MKIRRISLVAASLLILLMNFFRVQSLTCDPSEYPIENRCCPMCPPGSRVKTDCTEFRSTSCPVCTEGTFMNQPTGLKKCFSCSSCDKGSGLKVNTPCTRTSDSVCGPLEGFYCVDPSKESCVEAKKHSSCLPGQYISQNGTELRDTECSDCSEGTFSDGSFTSCWPHTQCGSRNLPLIKPGTLSTDSECGEPSSQGKGIVIGVVVVGLVLIVIVGLLVYYLKKKKKQRLGPLVYYPKDKKKQRPPTESGQDAEEQKQGLREGTSDKHGREQDEERN